jgi:hypothetical protein
VIHLSRDGLLHASSSRAGRGRVVRATGASRSRASASSNAPRFDYLIVDAYSSDAVPLHLLTREAIALYLDSLAARRLLAIHTSSRHFDLLPVLSRLAEEAHVSRVSIESAPAPKSLLGRVLVGVPLARRGADRRARAARRAAPPRARTRARAARGAARDARELAARRSGPTTTATSPRLATRRRAS